MGRSKLEENKRQEKLRCHTRSTKQSLRDRWLHHPMVARREAPRQNEHTRGVEFSKSMCVVVAVNLRPMAPQVGHRDSIEHLNELGMVSGR